jgi:uncharacterized repeat protein (TIGR03803 family)
MKYSGLAKFVFRLVTCCAATTIASTGQTLTPIAQFDGGNGIAPSSGPLVQGTDGNFYGLAAAGGMGYCGGFGCGTVFKVTPSGQITKLHTFCPTGVTCPDGAGPSGGLLQAVNGNFYGVTSSGGAYGYGEVFELTTTGTLTHLYNFCAHLGCSDGQNPWGEVLVQATDGALYGTTSGQFGVPHDYGTIFRLTLGGSFSRLYSFCAQPNCADGRDPTGLVQGSDGDFYGTTFEGAGGASCSTGLGCGTVFKITSQGVLTTLYTFCSQANCTDGFWPLYSGALVEGSDGSFYGTTYQGGVYGKGTVFKISPTGTFTSLYSFCADQTYCIDGEYPQSGLVQATDGNFYGTTSEGGDNQQNAGTIFQITPEGQLTTVYNFCSVFRSFNCLDGSNPNSTPMQATDGNLYGTTAAGGGMQGVNICYVGSGYNGCGTVFKLSMGLGPFVTSRPTSGRVGQKVLILGNNLTGTSSVTFNGTAAKFTVISPTEIQTTVPNGATTGIIEVLTPSGTLDSNKSFTVTP